MTSIPEKRSSFRIHFRKKFFSLSLKMDRLSTEVAPADGARCLIGFED